MKTPIEEAAKKKYPIIHGVEEGKSMQNAMLAAMQVSFEDGAISDAAREYWQAKFLSERPDFEELREMFFKECTNKRIGIINELCKVDMAPHDLFEWFKPYLSNDEEMVKFAEWVNRMDIFMTNEGYWIKNNSAFREKHFAESTQELIKEYRRNKH